MRTGAQSAVRPGGCLVLVVGASGVGKDTLLRVVEGLLAGRAEFVFPHRHITRPAEPSEPHVPLTQADFEAARRAGAFALAWQAHGHGYGISRDIERDLDAGRIVVCNVSRTIVAQARQAYQKVRVIEIVADRSLRAARLVTRGRESEADIAARLAREPSAMPTAHVDVVIDNSAAPADGIATLHRNLLGLAS